MQLTRLYQHIIHKLSLAGVEDAHVDASQLLCFCLGLTRSDLILQSKRELSTEQLEKCNALLTRRLAREPFHYITGTREFWSLDFKVSPAVLVPRPETEFLLEVVISTFATSGYNGGRVLDMCTGSGVIAVVLALELNSRNVLAVDSSPEALGVAADNIVRHGREKEISLVCSDLFSAMRPHTKFELIVANPPYISDSDLEKLPPEVREWEPESALAAGRKGIDVIEDIVKQAPLYLLPGGWLFLEIGADQKALVRSLFTDHGSGAYDKFEIIHDWAERPRVLKARIKG